MNAPFRQPDYDRAGHKIGVMSDALSAMESNYGTFAAAHADIQYATPIAIDRCEQMADRLERLAKTIRQGSQYLRDEWDRREARREKAA